MKNIFLPTLPFVGLLLCIPFISMQFSEEVNWGILDFILAGFLLTITGMTIHLIIEKNKDKKAKVKLIGITLFCLLIIWIELAVGILGTPFAGN